MAVPTTLLLCILGFMFVPCRPKGCSQNFSGPFGQSCYQIVLESKIWDDAQTYCRGLRTNLASITSDAELDYIWDILDGSKYYYWIGLHRNSPTTDWKWADGTPYDTSWQIWWNNHPRPQDTRVELYLTNTGAKPKWRSGSGTGANSFICEQSLATATPQPSAITATPAPSTRKSTSTTPEPTTLKPSTAKATTSTSMTAPAPQPPMIVPNPTQSSNKTKDNGDNQALISTGVKTAIGIGIVLVVLVLILVGWQIYKCRCKKRSDDENKHVYTEPNYTPNRDDGLSQEIGVYQEIKLQEIDR